MTMDAQTARYEKNCILTPLEQGRFRAATVAVVGLGGLGGYVAEQLVRLGIGHLVLIDGDVFQASNLNRQLFCEEAMLGIKKTEGARKRLLAIDGNVRLSVFSEYLNVQNGKEILGASMVVVDATDNNHARSVLLALCNEIGVPMIYGAIGGWFGQVCTAFPGDNTVAMLLRGAADRGVEVSLGNPAFTPALIASLQVAEVVKVLTGKGQLLRGGFLYCDLLTLDFEFIHIEKD